MNIYQINDVSGDAPNTVRVIPSEVIVHQQR